MRRAYLFAVPSLWLALSCGFLLDFDALQKGGPGAVASGGLGGTGGSTTTGGTNGGGGGSGTGGVAAGVPLNQLASELATAMCANLSACYLSAVKLIIHDEDCPTFFTNVIEDQTVAPIRQSVDRGVINYDPVKGAQCVANLAQGTQQSPPVCVNVNALLEDCKAALGGLAAADQPCGQRFECQRGLVCVHASGCPGACSPYRPAGAACQQDAECDPIQGLYCRKAAADAGADAGAASGTCQPYVAINAACTDQDQCVAGALCISNVCRALTSVFKLDQTFACFGNGLLCSPGLSCEFTGVPIISAASCVQPKAALAECRLALPGECPKDYYCNANVFNVLPGQCIALPTENQPCAAAGEQTITTSAPCHAGLACVNGICKTLRRLGEACEADGQCYSGACRAPSEAGAAVCVTPGCS